MVFNWFRRQFNDQQEKKEEQKSQSSASPEEVEATEEEETTASEPTPVEATKEEETTANEPTPVEATEEEETTTSEPTPTGTPAWLQQSGGLEKLKESAIDDTPEPEPVTETPTSEETVTTQDEETTWSAQVLANQGRTPEEISEEEISWLKQLRRGLGKTRRNFLNQLKATVGKGPLNEEAVMEIEALLLQADVGIEATDYIVETLQAKMREEALPLESAIAYLKEIVREILERPFQEKNTPITFAPEQDKLNIWLITGVNGAGKTTTIGKLAHLGQKSDYTCLIAAADTFRAAAVEQVKAWGDRANTEVVANPGKNTDPAAVVYDAISKAQSKGTELLLVDTAGRLQNKKNLMEELGKIRKVIDKKAPDANIESLLVIDASLGQNGLRQAEAFTEVARLSGVVLTKLDGSSKGGVALAISKQLNLPIRFIGAGEGIEDLRPFSSYEFAEALLSE
ncbi:signal recognition particle-docking protein FtsY [Euhalothece natronophila Z-M001]|uniref:Signal recognition particle receptor FtsY n=1 Tax=Euhalothece natronophila Z-M001 TaxID=522448 RepID=A0A5B8NPD1_9CHRO|nr:signal recognition particle-docking protein FtsY [Euhalothece natronophila]QDZ40928.1 signal recognition particle-docking protein FtsY [Euhalothece natronophila Z-M001]